MLTGWTDSMPKRQIIAIGGAALPPEPDNLTLVGYFLAQAKKRRPRVCFIGTAGGDAESGRLRFYAALSQFDCRPGHLSLFTRTPCDLEDFIMGQDAIFVGGGNTRSMLAVWREWGLDVLLRSAWEHGAVLGGSSAGAICWFEHGLTDSVAGPLTVMNGLGLLAGSCCPHYDSEPLRRPTFRRLIASGQIAPGVAADDGVALHYVNDRLPHAVSSRPGASAYAVNRRGRRTAETGIATRRLAPEQAPLK